MLHVRWEVPSASGGTFVALLELSRQQGPTGITYYEVEREIELWPDGAVRRKAPTDRRPAWDIVTSEVPRDLEAEVAAEGMHWITADAFEEAWRQPEVSRSYLTRVLGWLQRMQSGGRG